MFNTFEYKLPTVTISTPYKTLIGPGRPIAQKYSPNFFKRSKKSPKSNDIIDYFAQDWTYY